MTVILGYLEIMRINGDKEDEMLLKVEQKAKRVMELINQFLHLRSWKQEIWNWRFQG